jgi:YHS domain-containing protein
MEIGAKYRVAGAWLLCAMLVAAAGLLGGCGTTHATVATSRGEQLMLLGYDPVAYFTDGKPARGKHTLAAATDGRTYYFATPDHRAAFMASPAKYEPQYGGFCANGAAYAVKLGSDPSQFEIRDGRLFIFGDVLGREMWLLDEKGNIAHADALWPAIADKGWRAQSLKAWTFKVPWYRTGPSLMAEWREKHPGRTLTYDTGGTFNNLVFKEPGWRAREGFGQPRLGVPGEADDDVAR